LRAFISRAPFPRPGAVPSSSSVASSVTAARRAAPITSRSWTAGAASAAAAERPCCVTRTASGVHTNGKRMPPAAP